MAVRAILGAVPSGHWMRWYCSMDRVVRQQMDPLDDLGQQVWRLPGEEALLGPVQTLHTPVLGLPVPVGEEERVVQVAGKQNRSHGYVSARSRIRPQAR